MLVQKNFRAVGEVWPQRTIGGSMRKRDRLTGFMVTQVALLSALQRFRVKPRPKLNSDTMKCSQSMERTSPSRYSLRE